MKHDDTAASHGIFLGDVRNLSIRSFAIMTSLSDRMVCSGLISKQPYIHDERSNRLWMTDPGREAAILVKKELIPVNARLKEVFSEEEMVVVTRWLESILQRFPS